MYFKISFSNVRKNYKDYGIYFVTLVMAVSLFYAFNTLGSQEAFKSATSDATRNMSIQLISIMSILSKFIALVLAFLIIYANNFLLKRRKKELGIYMILGMDSRKISMIFVLEVIMIGIISFVFGILLGFVLSQGISLVALKMFLFDLTTFKFTFSWLAFTDTLLAFGIIFIIVMLFNIRTINKVALIDLINASRKNESNKSKAFSIVMIIFTTSIAMLVGAAYLVYQKNGLLPNSKWFKFVALFGILGTTGFIYALYTVLLKGLQKQKAWYFKSINAFTLRQISSKINTNYITITIVSLLLTVTLLITSLGMGIALTINETASQASPFDVSVYQTLDEGGVDIDESITSYLQSESIQTADYFEKNLEVTLYKSNTLYSALINKPEGLWPIDKDLINQAIPMMALSDYNAVLEYHGLESIKLYDGEVKLNCKYEGTMDLYKDYLLNNDSIEINGVKYTINKSIDETIYFLGLVGMNDQGTLIVADSLIEDLTPYYSILNANLKDQADPIELDNYLLGLIKGKDDPYKYFTKTMMNMLYYGSVAMLAFICSYIGIVFLMISVAILALQQLTAISDNKYRYKMLNNIGVERRQLLGSLFSQITVYFATPLVVAVVYAVMLLPIMIEKVSQAMKLNISSHVGLTGILLLVIYGGYYCITYYSSKNIVLDQ